MTTKRLRDHEIVIGRMEPGPRNSLADVPGVRVGHCTLPDGSARTGVTAIIPHDGNLFREKVPAAACVINGYGKTVGLMQIAELGTIETPILLTNTLSVGAASDALVRHMLARNPDIGRTAGTVNPVVAECNDGYLSDIRALHITADHVEQALAAASQDFAEGAVGAGTGMSCYGLKGGIGTASRVVPVGETSFTLGILALTNFGQLENFVVAGRPVGPGIAVALRGDPPSAAPSADKGSIIIIVATDAPADHRQLGRIARRTGIGLARTGSIYSTDSGDIAIAFSTANRVPHDGADPVRPVTVLNERLLDPFFTAAADATEEAILNSMLAAESTTGRAGHTRRSLAEFVHLLK